MLRKAIVLLTLVSAVATSCSGQKPKKETKPATNPAAQTDRPKNMETITLGNGCFWCTEAIFQQIDGVTKVTSGYSGGHVKNPTYEEVCGKKTGHAEVIQLEFDTTKVSVDEILEVFWQTHDPTTKDRQGNDVGPQYRSVVFYHNDHQKERAEYYKAALDKSGAFPAPIVTEIEPIKNFYVAEDYHQNYYNDNKLVPYCYLVIRPKLEKFEKVFKDKMKKDL